MNSQPDRDLEERIQQLEAEVNSPPMMPTKLEQKASQPMQSRVNKLLDWFNSRSDVGKLIVIGVAAIVSIVILRAFLQLVATVISLALLAIVVYFGYQFFSASSSKNKNK